MPSIFDSPEFNERLFFPRRDASPPPPDAQDRLLEVAGARLHLRWHRSLPQAPTVLLFHGNGEVVSDYDDSAELFAAAGANLAVVDYRGYGRSTGTPTLRGIIADAPLVAEAVAAEAPDLIIMGRSLGSACAAELYSRAPRPVRAFIWESGFVDLAALISRRGLSPLAGLSASDLAAFDACAKLRRGHQPLLVLHGEQDSLIVPEEARRAFAEAGTTQKTLVWIPGHGHNDLSLAPEYWRAIARRVGTQQGTA